QRACHRLDARKPAIPTQWGYQASMWVHSMCKNGLCTLRIKVHMDAQWLAVNYWKVLVVFGGSGCDNRACAARLTGAISAPFLPSARVRFARELACSEDCAR